jgi:hypothetical protein
MEKKMKNKVLMSLVLLAFVTVGAAFAQQATLDKLTFTPRTVSGKDIYEVKPANNNISGAVVIPATYNNRPVTQIASFSNCKGITSVTIPASVVTINNSIFRNCTNLTSVTFQGSGITMNENATSSVGSFPGDLAVAYKAYGAGTYTRPANGTNWTKQGTASAPAPAVNTSLDGNWEAEDGTTIWISGNTATYSWFGSYPLLVDAVNKGYVKLGDQRLRNIKSTGNLTWSMEEAGIRYNNSNRNVATGVQWQNATYTMSANGQTLSENGVVKWTRERVFNN